MLTLQFQVYKKRNTDASERVPNNVFHEEVSNYFSYQTIPTVSEVPNDGLN